MRDESMLEVFMATILMQLDNTGTVSRCGDQHFIWISCHPDNLEGDTWTVLFLRLESSVPFGSSLWLKAVSVQTLVGRSFVGVARFHALVDF